MGLFPCKFRSYIFPLKRTFCWYLQTILIVVQCYSLSLSDSSSPSHPGALQAPCSLRHSWKTETACPRQEPRSPLAGHASPGALLGPASAPHSPPRLPWDCPQERSMPFPQGRWACVCGCSVSCSPCKYGEISLWATAGFWLGLHPLCPTMVQSTSVGSKACCGRGALRSTRWKCYQISKLRVVAGFLWRGERPGALLGLSVSLLPKGGWKGWFPTRVSWSLSYMHSISCLRLPFPAAVDYSQLNQVAERASVQNEHPVCVPEVTSIYEAQRVTGIY